MPLPQFPNLARIDRVAPEELRAMLPETELGSDYQWLSLRTWNPEALLSSLDGAVVVAFTDYRDPTRRFYGFSGGRDVDGIADLLLHTSDREGWSDELGLLSADVAQQLSDRFVVERDRDNDDYCYDPASVLALEGPAHRQSRKQRNAFRRRHGADVTVEFADASEANWTTLIELAESWAASRFDTHEAADEVKALIRCQEILSVRQTGDPVLITTLRLSGTVVAFDITEIIGDRWALNHFRHTDLEVMGSHVELRTHVAGALTSRGIGCWNAEQDLGVPGLRTRKLRDRPTAMIEKYSVRRRG